MAYMLSHLWLWWLLALVLGLVIGWLTCSKETTKWWTGWVPWGVLAFIAGCISAAFLVLSNRNAYMLETALIMFAAYMIGCCISCLLKRMCGAGDAAVVAPLAVSATEPAVTAPVEKTAPVVAPVPAAAIPSPISDGHPGRKPTMLSAPRDGKADDLKRIRGIGPQNEGRLHALGVWHFDQIAAWGDSEVEWVGSYLAFPGRIEREEWLSQAKILSAGAETEFSKRVAKGEVATSKDDGAKGAANVADLSEISNAKPAPKKK